MKREESQALRGFAILGIVLHNYCHFLNFAVKENEYIFYGDRPRQFWDMLMSMDSQLFVHVFSFLGHYGVPVFLFVSGFGLVMKYEKDDICYNPFRWMGYHCRGDFRILLGQGGGAAHYGDKFCIQATRQSHSARSLLVLRFDGSALCSVYSCGQTLAKLEMCVPAHCA